MKFLDQIPALHKTSLSMICKQANRVESQSLPLPKMIQNSDLFCITASLTIVNIVYDQKTYLVQVSNMLCVGFNMSCIACKYSYDSNTQRCYNPKPFVSNENMYQWLNIHQLVLNKTVISTGVKIATEHLKLLIYHKIIVLSI